jgi:hypothetical protein
MKTVPDDLCVKYQRIDGVLTVILPKLISKQDFLDWLNDKPNKKPLKVKELPDTWTSAEDQNDA